MCEPGAAQHVQLQRVVIQIFEVETLCSGGASAQDTHCTQHHDLFFLVGPTFIAVVYNWNCHLRMIGCPTVRMVHDVIWVGVLVESPKSSEDTLHGRYVIHTYQIFQQVPFHQVSKPSRELDKRKVLLAVQIHSGNLHWQRLPKSLKDPVATCFTLLEVHFPQSFETLRGHTRQSRLPDDVSA